jgi:hypothetical protein
LLQGKKLLILATEILNWNKIMRNNIRKASAIIFTILIGLAAILHAYWALGGCWFLSETIGGKYEPGTSLSLHARIGTCGLSILMIMAALLTLGRVKLIWQKIQQWFYALSCWIMAVCMFLGVLKTFPASGFWNRFGFVHIWIILFILTLIIALPEKKNT